MELWIRSQDKEKLEKCNSVNINYYEKKYHIYGNIALLGFYTTKERAFEVLDEIQRLIVENADNTLVYEMPLE